MSTYAIISPIPGPRDALWDAVVQDHASARRSLDGASCIVKWPSRVPAPTGIASRDQKARGSVLPTLRGASWDDGR